MAHVSGAKLAKLKSLCGQREKLQTQLRAVNERIAGIRSELEALMRLAGVPPGVAARARVIPCASASKKKAAKKVAAKKAAKRKRKAGK